MGTEDTYKLVKNILNFNIDGIKLSGYYKLKFEGEKYVYLLPVRCTTVTKNTRQCKSAKTVTEEPIILDQEKFLNANQYEKLNYMNIEEPVTETIGKHELSNATGYVIQKENVIFKNSTSPPSYVAIPFEELVDYAGNNKIIYNIIKYIFFNGPAEYYIQEVIKDTEEQGGKRKTRRLRKVSKKTTKRSKKKSRRKSYRRRARC